LSHDLILWRGRPRETPAEVWKALRAGDAVEQVRPLVRAEIIQAFRQVYGSKTLTIQEGRIAGTGWELQIDDGMLHLLVSCNGTGEEVAAMTPKLTSAARKAWCSIYDPQSGDYLQTQVFALRPTHRRREPAPVVPPRFPKGAGVVHATLGTGKVLSMDGDKVHVRFDDGDKVLLARVLTLT